MRKSVIAVVLTLPFLLTGCSPSSTFLDSRVSPEYSGESEELDAKFLKAIKSSGKTNRVFSDEDYIRYGKLMCTLLDNSDNPEEVVEEYWGEDQVVSDAAIQIYCPEYSKNI